MKPSLQKVHREFFELALGAATTPWSPTYSCAGLIEELVLCDNLDLEAKTGARTRIARWHPGALLSSPSVHDFFEEVLVFQGEFIVGCDAAGVGGIAFQAHTFACRPPGAVHGPFTSRLGCMMLEFSYYE